MSKIYYAGIGARKTPPEILKQLTSYAENFSQQNYILRSGGAMGADRAFEMGCDDDKKEIFRPQDATQRAIEIASNYHPNWEACNRYVKKLHGRNAMILLGKHLNVPVEFVMCWTPEGKVTGGTGMALAIAEHYNIPVINLGAR